MRRAEIVIIVLIAGVLLLAQGNPATTWGVDPKEMTPQEQRVMRWRKERDVFLKRHQRSPLLPQDKIERFVFDIRNPKYYATFLTNKGTNKRYIRYGKFRFTVDGREYTIGIYQSI